MAKRLIRALALMLLLGAGLPSTQAYAAAGCDLNPKEGLQTLPTWGCRERSFEYVDAIAHGIPDIALGVVEACLEEWGIVTGSDYWIKTRDATAAFCPSLPPGHQQACYVSYTLGKLGKDATKCAIQGLIKRAPVGPGTRQGAQAAFDLFFDLSDDKELGEKFAQFGSMRPDEKHKFLRGVTKFWNKDMAEQSQHFPEFVEFFTTNDNIALAALDAARGSLDACDWSKRNTSSPKPSRPAKDPSWMPVARSAQASRR